MLQRCIDNLIKEATRETPQSPNGVIDAAEALVHLHMVPARPPAAEAKQPDPPNLLNPLLPAPFPPMSQRAATRPLPPRAQPILPHAALNSMYFNSIAPPHHFASPAPYGLPYAQHLLSKSSESRLKRLDSTENIIDSHNKRLRVS